MSDMGAEASRFLRIDVSEIDPGQRIAKKNPEIACRHILSDLMPAALQRELREI